MGGAVMVAFGIALGQLERRVLVITGDGELLAGIGSLTIVGVEKPKNLSIIVIDNEAYGATGNQQTHTGRGVDLVGIAKASGIVNASLITNLSELEKGILSFLQDPGPNFAVVKVGTIKVGVIPKVRRLPYTTSTVAQHFLKTAILRTIRIVVA